METKKTNDKMQTSNTGKAWNDCKNIQTKEKSIELDKVHKKQNDTNYIGECIHNDLKIRPDLEGALKSLQTTTKSNEAITSLKMLIELTNII